MSLLKGRKSNNSGVSGIQTPDVDHYDQWDGGANTGLFKVAKKQVILPGVTPNERQRLEKVREYVKDVTGEECTLPQNIVEDVYSMYVNENFKRRPVDGSNKVRQKIIDRVYNSLTKTVTQNSPLFSQMVTNELAVYMQKVQREIEEQQQKQQQGQQPGGDCPKGNGIDQGLPMPNSGGGGEQGQDEGEGNAQGDPNGQGDQGDQESQDTGGNGAGDGTNYDGSGDLDEQTIDDILDGNEKNLEKAMKDANDKMQDLEDKLGKENLEDLAMNEPDFMENMDNIKAALKRVAINKECIKEVLVKILNESNNYFSKNFDLIEESLFETDQFDDLFGLEFLHPVFRKAEIMNAGNATRRYKGKIDLYLDCSGSMDSKRNFAGTSIRMIDLVKGIAMVLYRMDMIEKLYFFDSNLYEIERINEYTILAFNKSGGTNFNRVVENCIKNKRNSVVITDGQDHVEKYTENVFWVGVDGTEFGAASNNGYYSYGGGGAFAQYRENRQCVTYDHKSESGTFYYCAPDKD